MPTPLINGTSYANANISVNPFGTPLVGITSIEYKRKQTKTNNYGAGVEPVSRGYGIAEYEGSIEVYLEEWKAFIAAAPGRDVLRIPPFNIPVTFSGEGVLTTQDTLLAVEFSEDSMESKTGDTSIKIKIPFIFAGLTR